MGEHVIFKSGGRWRYAPASPDWYRNLELRRSVMASPKAIMELSKLREAKR